MLRGLRKGQWGRTWMETPPVQREQELQHVCLSVNYHSKKSHNSGVRGSKSVWGSQGGSAESC